MDIDLLTATASLGAHYQTLIHETANGYMLLVKHGHNESQAASKDGRPILFKHFYQARDTALMFSAKISLRKAETV